MGKLDLRYLQVLEKWCMLLETASKIGVAAIWGGRA